MPASRRWCSTSSPTSSSSAASRATRSTPTGPTCCSSAPSSPPAGATRPRSSAATSPTSSPTWRPAARDGTGTAGARPCSPATINRKTACLRSFYRHLRREELIADDPTATLTPPQKSRKLPARAQPGRGDQAARERARAPTRSSLRDRALLEVMYGCGLRASEAIGLEIGDVDLRRGFVRPHGKGSKERIVPLGREAARAIERYLRAGRPQLVGDPGRAQAVRQLPRRPADPPGPLQDHPAPRQGGRARRAR